MRWKPILIGAGTGLTAGFAFGWWADEHVGETAECILSASDPYGPCLNKDESHYGFRIGYGLHGLFIGGVIGWLWAMIEAAPD